MSVENSFKKNGNKESLKNAFSKESVAPGMSWREWKSKKKEEYRKWKEEKMLKKQAKLQSKEKEEPIEEDKIEKPWYTVSIAVPGSIMDNAQTPSLKAHLVANIARSAAIYRVNEIIVYSESSLERFEDTDDNLKLHKKNHGCLQMVRILQFLECPPYLRKFYFPLHKDLEHTGEIHPLQLPSHLSINDESEYREGIVLNKPVKQGKGSYINIGLQKPAVIDKILKENVRVTVKLDKEQFSKKHFKGKAVSPTAPLKNDNIYWGYSVRLAKSFNAIFSESPYAEGYDVTVGTSDKGRNVDHVKIPKFNHLLIVFGGLKGIEACLEDEAVEVDDPKELFDYYLNVCPIQGTKTIRTEEAILATLATLRPRIYELQGILNDT
ncbi:putative methyltransferase C9orf114 homolog [Parasteatoda tepidariorum]|uniref:putative methyltransferase C9orf114 homolog n=1 Tax=Parasteatoda tepidariorum TaxID=114398 RepID=UPI0039BD00AA